MVEVWILLVLTCSGHVNAKCEPRVEYYQTQDACAENLVKGSVCFAVEGFKENG